MKLLTDLIVGIERRRYSGSRLDLAVGSLLDRVADAAAATGAVQARNWFADLARSHLGAVPAYFVETGTYRADNAIRVARHFSHVHTIELSPVWYQRAVDRLTPYPNVTCHQGDSAVVLGQVLDTIDAPAVIFLDAHYSGGTTAMGSEEVPLVAEMEAIGRRKHRDLIVIDDWSLAGKAGALGEAGNFYYDRMDYDWRHISEELMCRALGRPVARCESIDDRLVLVPA